jgi:hypothetical protein
VGVDCHINETCVETGEEHCSLKEDPWWNSSALAATELLSDEDGAHKDKANDASPYS